MSYNIRDIHNKLCKKELNVNKIIKKCIGNALNSSNNSYISLFDKKSITLAQESQERYNNNISKSIIDGIPISIKDNYNMYNQLTTAGSHMLYNYYSQYDATLVKKLKDYGAIIIGKTNMDEFGMGNTNNNQYYGCVYNPILDNNNDNIKNDNNNINNNDNNNNNYYYNANYNNINNSKLSAGGSSGGSAVSVIEGSAFASIGSDTGGSIRYPAAMCGLVGFKPTYGRLSRWGLISYASSMDTPGILCKYVDDAALLYTLLSGKDELDSTTLDENIEDIYINDKNNNNNNNNMKNITIGVPIEYNMLELNPIIKQHWMNIIDQLENAGATIKTISLPMIPYSLAAYYVIAVAEASSNLSKYDGIEYGYNIAKENDNILDEIKLNDLYTIIRSNGFGDEVKKRIILGSFTLSSEHYHTYVETAKKVRAGIANDFLNIFNNNIDVIITPTTAKLPMTFNEIQNEEAENSVAPYFNDVMTVPSNLAGLPSIAIPTGTYNHTHLPSSIQLITAPCEEKKLFNIASFIEHLYF